MSVKTMKLRLAALGILGAMPLFGCGPVPIARAAETTPDGQSQVAPPDGTASKPASLAETKRAATASNEFGLAFLAQIADSSANKMISPVSLTLALGLAANGAAGETESAMKDALRIGGRPDFDWQSGHYGLHQALASAHGDIEFSIANALWVGKNMPIETSFLDIAKRKYQSTSRSVDFASPSAAREINDWVAGQTNNRIRDLVKSTDAMTLMMIVNAIAFKGKWAVPFEAESTRNGMFFTGAGGSKTVKMMNQEAGFLYGERDGHQVLRLPYKGDRFEMVMILPKKGTDIAAFAQGMTPASYEAFSNLGKRETVLVTIPKWTSEATIDGKMPLVGLGMGIAFQADRADFSRLSKMPAFISSVTHKSFIKVDEEGTEAAAATAVEIKVTSAPVRPEPKVFRADRPFLYAISDTQTGAIVFLGYVADPTLN